MVARRHGACAARQLRKRSRDAGAQGKAERKRPPPALVSEPTLLEDVVKFHNAREIAWTPLIPEPNRAIASRFLSNSP